MHLCLGSVLPRSAYSVDWVKRLKRIEAGQPDPSLSKKGQLGCVQLSLRNRCGMMVEASGPPAWYGVRTMRPAIGLQSLRTHADVTTGRDVREAKELASGMLQENACVQAVLLRPVRHQLPSPRLYTAVAGGLSLARMILKCVIGT